HPNDMCSHWLRAISTLGASSLLPAALSAQITLVESPVLHAKILQRLIIAFVRWNVIQGGESTELEEAAYRVARMIRSKDSLTNIPAELRPFLGDDHVVRKDFEQLSLARSGYQRYILEAIEDQYLKVPPGHRPEKTVAGSQTLWIEHVY